jgi:UDP-N-acetylmuramate--alanine ligase
VLAEIVNDSFGIAVCGTHGKTTTSTFIVKLLRALGASPSWCIGGETGEMPVAGVGKDGTLVVEADESDGTLALYHAKMLVVMNMDYDHPEHFPTEAAYRACYETAISQAEQTIMACALDPSDFPELSSLVNGAHNVLNARAAIEVALRLGHSPSAVRSALPAALSELPDRRFQRIWPESGAATAQPAGMAVYTDYAHHPRELECAVSMAASLGPNRLRVIFQPHRYSRTRALCADFPPAFSKAHEVVLVPVYPAFENPVPGGDIADLYKAFRDFSAQDVKLARSAKEAWRHAYLSREPGDLVLIAGAGDVIKTTPLVKRDFTSAPAAHRRIFIGGGTNTWRSDLVTDEEYMRTEGSARLPGAMLGVPWMVGIPGTIGGWVKMNAGAFGHSISEVVGRVKVDDRWIDAADCGFAYRHSDISGEIQDVEFDFAKAGLPLLAENPRAYAEDAASFLARRKDYPPGTKGSVFKNPQGDHAGRLLEAAGAKSLRVGGAYVWQEHANVIIAEPGATASDFLALARLMARAVLFKFGIQLEPEVCGLDVW